jgi:hypothetical protein
MPNDLVKWIQELKSLLAHPLLKWKQLLQISRGLLLRSHGMLLTIKMFTRSIEIISLAGIPIRFHSHPIITIPHPSPSPLSRPNSFALRLQIQSVWMSQRLGLGSQKLNEQWMRWLMRPRHTTLTTISSLEWQLHNTRDPHRTLLGLSLNLTSLSEREAKAVRTSIPSIEIISMSGELKRHRFVLTSLCVL